MKDRTKTIVKAALSVAHATGADGWLSRYTRGRGVIFMLHHVRPQPPRPFEPNRILSVTPSFLAGVVGEVRSAGFEIVSLDEAAERLQREPGVNEPPFACFTLDDGYRDNLEFAHPVFAEHGVPFAVYVASEFADGVGNLWWQTLETVFRDAEVVQISMDGGLKRFEIATTADKYAAYERVYWWLRGLPEHRAREVVAELATSIGYDPSGQCRALVMSWDELRQLAADPLVTIGAHTRGHYALAKLSEADARAEIGHSVAGVAAELGRPCRHFSYPYGCSASAGPREFRLAAEAGLLTATTTAKGFLTGRHRDAMTALPRVSLNGDFQDLRYVRVMLSGAPFALLQAMSGA